MMRCCLDDEMWDILEDGIDIEVNGVGMVTNRKIHTLTQKKTYINHHRVRGILVDALPLSQHIKIIDKSNAKTIFESLCATYEGNQQVKEAKVNLLVQQYELFKIKDDEDIETMLSRFQVLVSGLQVLNKSYATADHVKKILRSLPIRYTHKVTAIQEAKDLNTLSFESLISNLQIHEVELNDDEPVLKPRSVSLRSNAKISGDKTSRSSKVRKP